ncbi:hypothetical protein NQ314_010744 [Rhamnusium bicolor]|uniref:Uncharacterized protein n=1 Tax=Rhamnusium bicolor TaxID=1586634 RepID=A0AAV8XMR9_9CUCU|nr:hypothetical protein NQ314_010744 [Rhamnusium bicolor]
MELVGADEGSTGLLQDDVEPPTKKSKEDDAERRHQERLAMQERAINSFETIMNKLIDRI